MNDLFKPFLYKKNKWDHEDIKKHIDEFKELYDSRPIKDNDGGMKSSHLLSIWYILKQLNPRCIIESGVWKGLGTWFFEKASPSSKIVSIDPDPSFRVYTSPNVMYRTMDFLKTDWSNLPKNDTVLFLDDHQNSLERIKYAHSIGFKKIIVEDNYPSQQGDCYSPKKILSNKKFVIDKDGTRNWFNPILEDYEYLSNIIDIYQEMPVIFKPNTTRWGDIWDSEYETVPPLFDEADKDLYSEFYKERYDYTWMCYLELK